MFSKGERVVSFNGPVNPIMRSCPKKLMPSSAFWIRGEVVADDGITLTLDKIERNSHVTGVAGVGPSSTKWYPSSQEAELSLATSLFQRDLDLSVSNENQVAL